MRGKKHVAGQKANSSNCNVNFGLPPLRTAIDNYLWYG